MENAPKADSLEEAMDKAAEEGKKAFGMGLYGSHRENLRANEQGCGGGNGL